MPPTCKTDVNNSNKQNLKISITLIRSREKVNDPSKELFQEFKWQCTLLTEKQKAKTSRM